MKALTSTYDSDRLLLHTVATGRVGSGDLVRHRRDLLEEGGLQTGAVELLDLSSAEGFELSPADLGSLVTVHRELRERGFVGSVFVAPRDLEFGMVRMLGSALAAALDVDLLAVPVREPIPLDEVRAFLELQGLRGRRVTA